MPTETLWNIDEEEGDWIKEVHKKRIAEEKKQKKEFPNAGKPDTGKPDTGKS